MKMNRLLPIALLAALASSALAQEIEVGYRFVDVTGNQDLYRSQINDRPGFLVRSLTWNGEGLSGSRLFDTMSLSASDLGAGPAGAARFTASKSGAYRLDLTYRNTQSFSAEPYFANPLLSQGVTLGQHTYDRTRHALGVELTLLPGKSISPFVGYTYNRYAGPGATTYTVGGDEFRLSQDLAAKEEEFHIGADFGFGPVSGHLFQGWRHFQQTETLALVPGAGAGNGPNPVLGQDVSMTAFSRTGSTKANTPITEALVTVVPLPWVKIIGTYVNATAEGGDSSTESNTGSFVSFALSRFFKTLDETTGANARNKTRRGSGRIELSILEGLDLSAGYSEKRSTLSGYDLISSLYGGTTTFAGLDPKSILQTIQANTSMDRTEKTFETRLSARSLGPLSAFLGWSSEKQAVTVTEDPSEIVVPGSQSGTYNRSIQRLDAGVGFRAHGIFASADFQRALADNPVVRVDFNSRDRYRIRGGYSLPDVFTLSLSAQQVDTKNDWSDTAYDAKSRQYGAELSLTPVKTLSLRASMYKYEGDSSMVIREPQNFNLTSSVYAENGRSWELGGSLHIDPVTLDASFSRFANEGNLPFRILRARVAADMTLTPKFAVVAEWLQDDYRENTTALGIGDYLANRYGLFLRIHP
jgi:hypothetical protein